MTERQDYLFTSESVGEGHPDKICDQISDAVLDSALKQDPGSRVACESFTTTGLVLVGGEITTGGYIDLQRVVRGVLKSIGYDDPDYGIDYQSCAVLSCIHEQSRDIAQGVGSDLRHLGAGDQGMMFGFACRETPELMPAPIHYAHAIMRRAALVRKRGILPFMRPDGKCQVTVRYEKGVPREVMTVVLSHQHAEDVSNEELREAFIEEIIRKAIPAEMLAGSVTFHINPTGRFVIGGPHGDTGLTGRKIIVDTYGGVARHGGGSFSGKDPTKVDRSASYMMRYVAKNLVAAGAADRLEIQVSYAIGVAHPVSIAVETFGTGKISDESIVQLIHDNFDLRPAAIIRDLNLRRPIYKATAAYGHFGRTDIDAPWEKLDKVAVLKKAAGLA